MARRDDDQFTAFVAGSATRLRRTAYLICGDWQQAADITQEALIRVYVNWPRLDKLGGLPTYARRALVSVAIDMGRKRSSTEVASVPDDTTPAPTDVESSTVNRDTLLTALAQLPPRQRACVVLRYFEDLSVSDVASLLEISDGTVKSQTSRALTSLQSIIKSQSGEDLLVANEGTSPW